MGIDRQNVIVFYAFTSNATTSPLVDELTAAAADPGYAVFLLRHVRHDFTDLPDPTHPTPHLSIPP